MQKIFEYEACITTPRKGAPRLEYIFKGARDYVDYRQAESLLKTRRDETPDRRGFLVRAENKQEAMIRLMEINRTPQNLDGFYIL